MADPEIGRVDQVAGWRVEQRTGGVGALHGAEVGDTPLPAVWICRPTRPGLVLGSTQRSLEASREALGWRGLDLAVRRSGGGAVLVDPGHSVWIDLIVPAGHMLWDDDVGRATHWVGDAWARALATVGIDSTVYRGPMRVSEWSRSVCFVGLGPGEVTDPTGRKLVGISQRRTRAFARFQTIAYTGGDLGEIVEPMAELGAIDSEAAPHLAVALRSGAGPLAVDGEVLTAAVVAALPPA